MDARSATEDVRVRAKRSTCPQTDRKSARARNTTKDTQARTASVTEKDAHARKARCKATISALAERSNKGKKKSARGAIHQSPISRSTSRQPRERSRARRRDPVRPRRDNPRYARDTPAINTSDKRAIKAALCGASASLSHTRASGTEALTTTCACWRPGVITSPRSARTVRAAGTASAVHALPRR